MYGTAFSRVNSKPNHSSERWKSPTRLTPTASRGTASLPVKQYPLTYDRWEGQSLGSPATAWNHVCFHLYHNSYDLGQGKNVRN